MSYKERGLGLVHVRKTLHFSWRGDLSPMLRTRYPRDSEQGLYALTQEYASILVGFTDHVVVSFPLRDVTVDFEPTQTSGRCWVC